jgi:beta-lactamase regulating signal transducer with metallopeptidase domain
VLTPANIPFLAPADTAQAVATVYTVSLLATLPIAAAAVAAFALRRAGAEARLLALRAACLALLLAFIGRQLPLHWIEWVLPSPLATPLVALGRVQVTSGAPHAGATGIPNSVSAIVSVLFFVYLAGVCITLVPMLAGSWRVRSAARRARTLHTIGRVRVMISDDATVPMTWGFLRPVIVLPASALSWPAEQQRMTVLHELSHVRAGDWTMGVLTRLTCALYWCHPGAWWLARAISDECELACDERVIAAGVRRSDYAELLVSAADRLLPANAVVALSGRHGLRARLSAIVGSANLSAPLAKGWLVAAVSAAVIVAAPTSTVQLAPTRDMLTHLVRDASWESRAYAVIGLARRADPDSVAVARAVAEGDPDPQVRAWARYALRARGSAADLRAILRQ